MPQQTHLYLFLHAGSSARAMLFDTMGLRVSGGEAEDERQMGGAKEGVGREGLAGEADKGLQVRGDGMAHLYLLNLVYMRMRGDCKFCVC